MTERADHVFICFPCRPGEVARRTEAGGGRIRIQPPCLQRTQTIAPLADSSDYCRNFNHFWCTCHNDANAERFTHFAMCHDDVIGDPGWADILIDEMDKHAADVMACVIPIKDPRRLTSTGIRSADGSIRRLTMREVFRLPETFGIEEALSALGSTGLDTHLVVNTGLWVVRLDWQRLQSFPGFSTTHSVWLEEGRLRQGELTEDWAFSSWAYKQGLRVCATRAVCAIHVASDGTQYRNDEIGDGWETDRGDN